MMNANELNPLDVAEYIRKTTDGPVFFEPLAGNNGDQLIRLGAEQMLARAGLPLTNEPGEAATIFINGGGAMNDLWKHGLLVLQNILERYPHTPVVVGPSSYWFTETNLTTICSSFQASLTLFARERRSIEHLNQCSIPNDVRIQLGHDLAVELNDSKWLHEHRRNASTRYILIAMRRDLEGNAGYLGRTRAPWLPQRIRKWCARWRDKMIVKHQCDASFRSLLSGANADMSLPWRIEDVSSSCDFDAFVASVRDAGFIVTDRLHVALLGQMMGKQVLLKRGRYHKIEGVHEMTMASTGLVTLFG